MKASRRQTAVAAARGFFAVLLAVALSGCATSGARLDRSQEVFDSFISGTVLPGYTYYTTGMQNNPDAILGIRDGVTLRTERWLKRDMTEPLLRQLVGQMNTTYGAMGAGLLGSAVLNDKGERIGLWYSVVGLTVVEMISDTEVRVSPPNRIEMERSRSRGGGR